MYEVLQHATKPHLGVLYRDGVQVGEYHWNPVTQESRFTPHPAKPWSWPSHGQKIRKRDFLKKVETVFGIRIEKPKEKTAKERAAKAEIQQRIALDAWERYREEEKKQARRPPYRG